MLSYFFTFLSFFSFFYQYVLPPVDSVSAPLSLSHSQLHHLTNMFCHQLCPVSQKRKTTIENESFTRTTPIRVGRVRSSDHRDQPALQGLLHHLLLLLRRLPLLLLPGRPPPSAVQQGRPPHLADLPLRRQPGSHSSCQHHQEPIFCFQEMILIWLFVFIWQIHLHYKQTKRGSYISSTPPGMFGHISRVRRKF